MRFSTLKLAVRSLLLHKLRSALTMLGTILGAGSVIAMLAVGEGSKRHALEQIRRLGASNVILRTVESKAERAPATESGTNSESIAPERLEFGLLDRDLERIQATIPTIRRAVPLALVRQDARFARRRMLNARILGTTPDYLEVKSLAVHRGRFLSDSDVSRAATVAVLGAGAAARLFGHRDPIGRSLLLGEVAVVVVGILDTQGSGSAESGALSSDNFNNDIYIPLRTCRQRFGDLLEKTQLTEITLGVRDEDHVSQTAAMARILLDATHPLKDDFEIQVPLELLEQAEEEKKLWNLVLGSIAGVSLLVGGIGIMNIMLATITERTREIGVRRALGAKRKDITVQFLLETLVLSTTGALLGILVGVTAPSIVSAASEIDTVVKVWSVALAFAISVGVGVVFGVYPALRAALMDPIEALRHE